MGAGNMIRHKQGGRKKREIELSIGCVTKFSQWLHRQLREIRSFLVTRHNTVERRAVRSPSQEESILNAVADRPQSSTRVVAYLLDSDSNCCS
ncbi:hypothetical protein TNCV_3721841 [Trichonephila clavipes]|nr:hypothetical protein TNCV_3721841 [Trichonephila clavipes]